MNSEGVLIVELKVQPTYRDYILQAQQWDNEVSKMRSILNSRIETPFWIADDKVMMMRQRMYVPNNEIVKQKIL